MCRQMQIIGRNHNRGARPSAVILRNIQLLFNMADRATRGAKPAISYASLHNLCNIHFEKKRKQPRKAKGKFYEAVRVIEKRNGRDTVLHT